MSDIDSCIIIDHSVQNFAWEGIKKLYQEEHFFDIQLLASDGEISAHKVILASVSTYFKLLLSSQLTPKTISSVDVTFCESEILQNLLNFVYTGEINLNQKNIISLVQLQDFLGIGILHHHLTYYMLTTITESNCWVYHELADKFNYKDVFVKIDRFIRVNFMKLITGRKPEFLNVSHKQLFSFFESNFLGVSSSEHECLLISLCEWMGASPEERIPHLDKLLSNVDIARIASWRGMSEKLTKCFPPAFHSPIQNWADLMGEQKRILQRMAPFNETSIEAILLIGGIINEEVVATTDVFIPPMIMYRVLPRSCDMKELTIIPPMLEKRANPTPVSSSTSVYVLGGTKNHEELKFDGIPCEAYKISENRWYKLPNLPPRSEIIVSTNRRLPGAFVEGKLYAALPSPPPSVWELNKNESSWTQLPCPKLYEIYDLVGVSGAMYCIGREHGDSMCFSIHRYDTFSKIWGRISTLFFTSLPIPHVVGMCLENSLCVTTGPQWLKFDHNTSDWKGLKCGVSYNGYSVQSFCIYKEKQVVSLKRQVQDSNNSVSSLELSAAGGSSDFYMPGRVSAGLASIHIPVLKPEPI